MRGYFLHRLSSVGWQGQPAIDDGIFEHVHRASTGIPRWINQIGSRLMLHGMLEEKQSLGAEDALKVINDPGQRIFAANKCKSVSAACH